MMFKSIRSRLALSFAGIALIAALALGAVLLAILRNYYSNQELDYLIGNARAVSIVVSKMIGGQAPHDEVQSQIENLAFLTQTRIQVYGTNDNLLYDSGSPQNLNVNLGVMKQTLIQSNDSLPKDKVFIAIGRSPSEQFGTTETIPAPSSVETGSQDVMIYHSTQSGGSVYNFALKLPGEPSPVTERSSQKIAALIVDPSNNQKTGNVQLSEGPAYGSAILSSVARGWLFSSAIAVLLAALIGSYISRRISAPVLALTNVTSHMAQGDLSSRADVKSGDEFGQLARSFNEMAEQVEQTISTLRAFVADAAHELHTPLAALQANLELARDEKDVSKQTGYLKRAQEQSRRLEALVQSLLDLSRIEAKESKSEFAQVDILQLVREVGEQSASRAEQADRNFSMQLPDAVVVIQGNETQLRQVVINLLENALKFTPADGTIALALQQHGNEINLIVSDSGIGIPPEDLPHLFERFHRGRNASEYPGNGLGLAIVKAIVNQHQGNIVAQPQPMQGTSIFVSLPIA